MSCGRLLVLNFSLVLQGEHKSAFFFDPSGCLLEVQTFTDPAWPTPSARPEGVVLTPRATAQDMADLTDPTLLNSL